MNDVNIIVVGGGIVGASFALQMSMQGAEIVLVEPNPPTQFSASDELDHRVYAITPANMELLEKLKIFSREDRQRFAPINAMQINADQHAKLEFSAREANISELAIIMEHRLLAARLQEKMIAMPNIKPSATKLTAISQNEHLVIASAADGQQWRAPLLVGADGGVSWVRNECGFATTIKDYQQVGIVANFRCEQYHGNIARQWFGRDDVLAWLPLPGQQISIVWSVNAERGAALYAMAGADFSRTVMEAGGNVLGNMAMVSPQAKFPLRLQRTDTVVQDRIVLIGDAAHVVHPLAGQGLNLGLQDANELAQILSNKSAPEGFGDCAVLRRYERARREPVAAMQTVTDGLQGLFASHSKIAAMLRNNGLILTNQAPWLKKRLVREAVG